MYIVSVVDTNFVDYPSVMYHEDKHQLIKNMLEYLYKTYLDEMEECQRKKLRQVYENLYTDKYDETRIFNVLEDCGFLGTLINTDE